MAIQFKIKKGLKASLPKTGELGCWYLTTDTKELYACIDEENLTLSKVNDAGSFDPTEINNKIDALDTRVTQIEGKVQDSSSTKTYASKAEFPNVGAENIIYIAEDENAVYRWDSELGESNHYVCVGRDYKEIKIIDGGDARQFN